MQIVPPPVKRSPLRRSLGKLFYTWKRQWQWIVRSGSLAKTISADLLPHAVMEHKSFLLRPLKNVDMHLQYNKIENLRLAIERINGLVIKPGETFSVWYLVGRPSARRGFKAGLVLNQGQIEQGIGGGLCQLGNLLFWMALHSPLTISERYRHGYDVFPDISRTIPFGCGATLSYNYIDLQLTNNTQQNFQVNLWLSEEYLHGEIRCEHPLNHRYEVYESHHQFEHQPWGGYTRHNQIKRKMLDKISNKVIEDIVVLENHAIMMYAPLLKA